MPFLAPVERYGSEESTVPLSSGAGARAWRGLPRRDEWPAWNAADMRAAVDHLERAAAATESGALAR